MGDKKEALRALDDLRGVLADCEASESELYDELIAEAEGWKYSLRELDDDEGEIWDEDAEKPDF